MNTLILGTNLRGLADVARICLDNGDNVVVYDSVSPNPPDDLVGRVTELPTEWVPENLEGVDRVVTSPWFAEVKPPLSDVLDAGVDTISEVGFGLENTDVPFVAITGTNGKTTVTELVTTMLNDSGSVALSAGNLGKALTSVGRVDADVLVLELSSYQLRFLGSSVPIAAALLNVAPDHLDWHGTFDAYKEAKARIFVGMDGGALLVYNADDPVVVSLVEAAECTLLPCSGSRVPDGGNGVEDGRIVIGGTFFDPPTDDPSFLFDLVVAASVAMAVGATDKGIQLGIESFVAGNHRREIVETTDGITWIDDSKATNPHATKAAVAAHAPVVLLAGGQNKGLDLSPIGELDGVTDLILFGEAGPVIHRSATKDKSRSVVVVESLEEAVEVARTTVSSGDTVLLSPGCASFDEFSSYAERGDVFQRLVRRDNGAAA